ncbi:hypothetical protein SAMN05216298_0047 [Glycomyces sambucus]|uniref:Uncharacterized protein n=1 Tax=Glycomyces sambucus TaxID=380244 RepID=A0A1G9MZH3_9ACTN|nr:hypothetical protein [Glycomyces sambucus]SDL79401.1 hypothetical protein SAMN05216298_0047 [Glycomyces sambucus]
MTLSKDHREFAYSGVSHLDYKQVDMDRVLTGLLPLLRWDGQASRRRSDPNFTVDTFVDAMLAHPDLFEGFDRDTAYRWAETHLLDLVNRGTPRQAVAGPRPLHGFTYLFRVAKHSRAYGADEQLYWMMRGAPGGPQTLEWLKRYLFAGIERSTDLLVPAGGEEIDVETQALINLWLADGDEVADRPVKEDGRRVYAPYDPHAAELLVEDLGGLLYHKDRMPRSVMIDHLKILFAFHLSRYHLLLLKSVPAKLSGADSAPGGFFLDVESAPGDTARLAERSARTWYDRIPDFVRGVFELRKLEEFTQIPAGANRVRSKPGHGLSANELLVLRAKTHKTALEAFGHSRLISLQEDLKDAEPDPELTDLFDLGLDPFTTYVEAISALRVSFHRKYIVQALDSLMLKRRPGAMIAQPHRGVRRFVLDSGLLEVLLQVTLLRETPGGRGRSTQPMRIDDFLDVLKERYGLHIDTLPPGDGFDRAGVDDQAALRANREALVDRLRQIGYYRDLSDAYLTQTITPRYSVDTEGSQV